MVIEQTEIEQYNYSAFKGGESDFLGFRSQLQVGSSAPARSGPAGYDWNRWTTG